MMEKEIADRQIVAVKELRRDVDAIVQRVKELPAGKSRESALAFTNLQQGVMWLGMELKRLGDLGHGENPYPNSKDPSNTKIDPTADGLKL